MDKGGTQIFPKTKNKFIYLGFTFSDEFYDRSMSNLEPIKFLVIYRIQWNGNSEPKKSE